LARHFPARFLLQDHFEKAKAMKTFRIFGSNQHHRPGPKPYFRPVRIEALRFSQSMLAQSIR